MKLVIISGRSGSGKTIALRTLEDHGFYCIDNLPIQLLSQLPAELHNEYAEVAVSIDARNLPDASTPIKEILNKLQQQNHKLQILFMDASDQILIKRFSETRRRHPLTQQSLSLSEALHAEHKILEPISSLADLVIQTDNMSQHQLKDLIKTRVIAKASESMNILFSSFGFKHGAPNDADFVFDARCLPNPYWNEELRNKNGTDKEIIAFLENESLAMDFYWYIHRFLRNWLPHFAQENRSYLTIAIGCTGGQHRSVFLAEKLAEDFSQVYDNVQVRHRELKK